jgi:hypothetical protein
MNTVSQKRLHELLFYCAETGAWTWKSCPSSRHTAKPAGWKIKDGYVGIMVDGRIYAAHRLAWFYQTGQWPAHDIDHVNGVRDDNRWRNLREATDQQNAFNRKPHKNKIVKSKGVSLVRPRAGKNTFDRYIARICLDGRVRTLGSFDSEKDAHEAYCLAAKQLHKTFARTA